MRELVTAWRPTVPGVREVFHARFVAHAYPAHTHDAWTLLIVDDGAIAYDLEQHHHGTGGAMVTLLPPHVPHDGRAATTHGFRKRVLYLDPGVLGEDLIGAAVDRPGLDDAPLRHRVHQLHASLVSPGDALEAESRLTLIRDRLRGHLLPHVPDGPPAARGLAGDLRDLLDRDTVTGLTLRDAAAELHAHPSHLVRAFTRAFGLPPHRYLTGRRVDAARRMLLAGMPPAEVATAAGFHDQPHLNRHFTRVLGVTPGRYAARSRASAGTRMSAPAATAETLTRTPR
ncbi:helix-turn-helix transcriptional regulator [Catenuloplanes atrovinosus]|uniref:AraC-like DNA-binding protein n=1 Tax=Catenuloplanes atrovinosus TaxID=137266 RepID=A0AAE3YSJ4_9ACTN|nr:AraC family transcriptional regulator [Catenuloplanes atrovinosus]MDR7278437.1 AraC-like DNA-binding protein [Catenuloplanes atrovinosus]